MTETFDPFKLNQGQTKKIQLLLTDDELDGLIKQAILLKKPTGIKGKISVLNLDDLKTIFSAKIAEYILDKKEMSPDIFLCGSYIADLLISIVSKTPESWYFIDYLIDNLRGDKNQSLKHGGDACFLICALFKERANWRAMNPDDYEFAGKGMYFRYYNQTGMEIAYHMSQKFATMARITNESIKTL